MNYIRKKYNSLRSCNWENISQYCVCCDMEKIRLCGQSLKKRLSVVAVSSIVLSVITFITAMSCLIYMSEKDVLYNSDPVLAAHLIIFLVITCISVYQFTISVMLLLQTLATKDDVFYYALWYVSHISILSLYWALLILELSVCWKSRQYDTAMAAVVITGTFSYFTVVVNAALYAVP